MFEKITKCILVSNLSKMIFNIKAVEILSWIRCLMLNLSLKWFPWFRIENLNIISIEYSYSLSVFVSFCELFIHSEIIILRNKSILHQFNISIRQGSTCLWSIIHNSKNSFRVNILHRNCCIDWIKVCSNIFIWILIVII